MPLRDHPYSDVNIIYSVMQTGERTTDRGTNSAPNIKRLCNGEYRPGQLYILSSRVSPDITDADVHALCTKAVVLKMEESGKSSRNHRTVRGTTETCRHQVNERSVWLPQRSMKVNWQPHVFHLHNKKEKKSVRCESESTKFKSVFDSHYQMHIRLTHNRSRRFHISVETTFSYQCGSKFIIRAHFSTYIYTYIWYTHTEYVIKHHLL